MRALVYHGPEDLSVEDIRDPTIPNPDWVRIRVRAAGLCGSDIHKILHDAPPAGFVTTNVLGHEIAGTVDACGTNVISFREGDPVVVAPLISCGRCEWCNRGDLQFCHHLSVIGRDLQGGFAEFVCVPASNVYQLPVHLTFDIGTLIDSCAVALHAIRRAGRGIKDSRTAVIGDGPLALLCVQFAGAGGATRVDVLAKHADRTIIARSLGASDVYVLGSEQYPLPRNSYDVVFEAVGGRQSASMETAIDLVRCGGTLIVLGVFPSNLIVDVPIRRQIYKEISVIGSNSYGSVAGVSEFSSALEMVRTTRLRVEKLITHRVSLNDFKIALDLIRDRRASGAIKIVLCP